MYYHFYRYPYHHPYYENNPTDYNSNYWTNLREVGHPHPYHSQHTYNNNSRILSDYGPNPFVININKASKQNNTFRTALWTGNHLQVTLMSLHPGEDIGLEMHPDVDQFLRVEQGQGITQMGKSRGNLNFQRNVSDDSAIVIPAGFWHNLTNTGNIPLKLYSIYAPPNHPFGTVHPTKAVAMTAEHKNNHHNGR